MAMAKRLVMLLMLVASFVAATNAKGKSGERLLAAAITSRNITVFRLTRNVVLTADLPPLPPNKYLTIVGDYKRGGGKVTIDGQGKYSIFKNSGSSVVFLTLTNLIIKDSTYNETVGAVSIGGEGSKVNIFNVDFVDNSRAINFYVVKSFIRGCTFKGSRMTAIFLTSEEGITSDTVTVTNSVFEKNRASTGFGGAAIYVDKYASVDVKNSTFIGNSVDYRGGAIRIREAFATISNSRFIGNAAKDQGGALTSYNSGVRVSNCLFQNNVARTGPGGAVRIGAEDGVGSVGWFSKCTFINNRALKSEGGAFVLDTYSDIYFCGATFSGNKGSKGANNGYVIGLENSIYTTTTTKVPLVTLARGAAVLYKTTKKCLV